MPDSDLNDTLIAQLSREVQKARIENRELAAAIAERDEESKQCILEACKWRNVATLLRSRIEGRIQANSGDQVTGDSVRQARECTLDWVLLLLDELEAVPVYPGGTNAV